MGGGWALEFESFLGPVNWHLASKTLCTGLYNHRCIEVVLCTRAHAGGFRAHTEGDGGAGV